VNEEAQKADWYGNCDPDTTPVSGQGSRPAWYVPLDAWPDPVLGETVPLRGALGRDALYNHILLSSRAGARASAQLFAGFRGTGKSTELARLAERLRETKKFAVLEIRADVWFHMGAAPTAHELGLVIVGAMADLAAVQLKTEVFKKKSGWQQVLEFLQDTEAKEGTLKLGVADLKCAFRATQGAFRAQLATLLGDKPEKLREFVHRVVVELATSLPEGQQLVVLVDGLEKFQVGPEQIATVYRQVTDLFQQQHLLLRLPRCHVVYTVPPYLEAVNVRVGEYYGGLVRMLPSVRVHGRQPEREPYEPGIRALLTMVGHRVDLETLFGEHWEACTRALVMASGGHVRDLLMLVRETVLAGFDVPLPLGMTHVEQAIAVWRTGPGGHPWPLGTLQLLQQIDRDQNLTQLPDGDLSAFAQAMDQFLVLAYRNGETWYDVHPLVRQGLSGASLH